MSNSIKFTDNSKQVIEQIKINKKRALTAVGLKGVEVIVNQMEKGYDKPIRISGDLQRSISTGNETEDTIDVGSNLKYAEVVHDGNRSRKGRPYITDGIMNNKQSILNIIETYLKQGM